MAWCRAVAVVAVALTAATLFNANVYGDKFRHRPFVLALVQSSAMPSPDLWPELFLYGDEPAYVRDGLRVLVDSLNSEAQLTLFGKLLACNVLHDVLQQRHCVSHSPLFGRALPDAQAPLIVVGLPRTGTTFLHGLLSQDEATWRTPRFHEYMSACPRPNPPHERGPIERLTVWIQDLKATAMRFVNPRMAAFHHIDAHMPEEDVMPLGHVMVSSLFSTVFHVPSYAAWVLANAPASAPGKASVDYLSRYLAYLAYDERPFLIKTPHHLLLLELLAERFPRARFVWMHRDPLVAMASVASGTVSLAGVGSNALRHPGFVKQVANHTVAFWAEALHVAVRARSRLAARVVDVRFEALRKDPLAVAEHIYKALGLSLSPQARAKMDAYAHDNAQYKKHGKHVYSLADVGLDSAAVREAFAFYDLNGTVR